MPSVVAFFPTSEEVQSRPGHSHLVFPSAQHGIGLPREQTLCAQVCYLICGLFCFFFLIDLDIHDLMSGIEIQLAIPRISISKAHTGTPTMAELSQFQCSLNGVF